MSKQYIPDGVSCLLSTIACCEHSIRVLLRPVGHDRRPNEHNYKGRSSCFSGAMSRHHKLVLETKKLQRCPVVTLSLGHIERAIQTANKHNHATLAYMRCGEYRWAKGIILRAEDVLATRCANNCGVRQRCFCPACDGRVVRWLRGTDSWQQHANQSSRIFEVEKN
jgi:hypothetical protein